jgi:cysteine desulfurase family protein (TIGR01976 family)
MTAFPVERVRAEFPALAIADNGKPRIYVDNPAGTQVPARVSLAVSRCLLETNANLGGYFSTSIAAEEAVFSAHRAMARFLGATSEREVIIGPSMTSLTFALSRSIGRTLREGDEVVVTRMDHDGNIGPWLAMAEERGVTVRWVPFDEQSWTIEASALEAVLNDRTRIVALNHASNLTGSINNVRELITRIHAAGALAYIDSVQFAPHCSIDVRGLDCDFLACSSYKFFGPHLGIVWGREELLANLYAYKVRPQTSELPYKFETGTPQIESLAALRATVEYFEWLGSECSAGATGRNAMSAAFAAASAYERDLTARLISGLQCFDGVRIIGISDPARYEQRVPTVSFTHSRRTPSEIARALAVENIFVWSGHNFALEIVRSLGIDEEEGVVRIGLAHYNTQQEVDRVLQALAAVL